MSKLFNKLINKVFQPFLFENAHYYFLLLIGIFFPLQSIYGIYHPGTAESYMMLYLTIISMALYFISYHFFLQFTFSVRFNFASKIHFKNSIFLIPIFYAFIILYTCVTASNIALFSAFKGADFSSLSLIRETFVRARPANEQWLRYFYNIMVFALMPYFITTLFQINHKFRYLYLILFLFTLLLTLEKGLSENIFIPLIILAINSKKTNKYKLVFGFALALIFTIWITSFLALGGAKDINNFLQGQQASHRSHQSIATLVKPGSKTSFIFNHIIWIPYQTGLAWLEFKNNVLHGENNYFESTHFIGPLLTGKPYYPLENEVFKYQYGAKDSLPTGSANVAYFIDAYVKFGIMGVILFTIFVAFLTRFIMEIGTPPIKSVFFLSLFYIAQNQLLGLLFSGGIILMVLIMLFSKFKLSECNGELVSS